MRSTGAQPTLATDNNAAARILFLTREPIVHQLGGSTTCALNLLDVLSRQGAHITVLSTLAYSRSPRLWFAAKVPLPAGVTLHVPGYWRIGRIYMRPFAPTAVARAIARLAARIKLFRPLRGIVRTAFGDRLFCEAWDLTPPTERETRAALDRMEILKPGIVVANYAFWGPLLARLAANSSAAPRRVILMHDLLSARVQRFLAAGETLDCPHIDEATELAWLDCADCVLASQAREAETIAPLLHTRVLVQPIVLHPRRAVGRLEPQRCLFVGSNILPNAAGLRFFLEQVWPQVRAINPAAVLAVAGTVCAALPPGSERDGVESLGVVPDIEAEYARAAVCVVPLLIGSGIKIKLLEALSFGKATVSTSIGIQGIEDWAEGVVEVADDANAFAAAVLGLLANDMLREQREDAALALIEQHYGAALTPEFLDVVLGKRILPGS